MKRPPQRYAANDFKQKGAPKTLTLQRRFGEELRDIAIDHIEDYERSNFTLSLSHHELRRIVEFGAHSGKPVLGRFQECDIRVGGGP